jgi:hypothetical protein
MTTRRAPVSVGQRLLWFVDHYRGTEGALNCPVICRLRGRLDVSALQTALDDLARRHESLRTTFAGRGRHLVQIIHEFSAAPIAKVDLSEAADPETAAQHAMSEELQTRIDPETWPVRVTLWRIADQDHLLCINVHHLVTDAWSCPVLFREFGLLLDRAAGVGVELPPVGWQYTQFADWQQRLIDNGELRPHSEYWCRQLAGVRVPELPYSGTTSDRAERRTAREVVNLESAVSDGLRRLARSERTTLFTVMLSLYYALLHRLTGQTDLAVGTLFANRLLAEVQNTIGFLANMVVLRTEIANAVTFDDVVRKARVTVTDAFMHQAVPYHLLPANIVEGGLGRINEVMFQMIAEPIRSVKMAKLEADVLVPEGIGSRFDLELVLVPRAGGFRGVLFYNSSRFDGRWARRFIASYAAFAAAVAVQPGVRLAELAPSRPI